MGVGSIFVATTLAPLVIVLASVSLQILTIGLEQLKNCECLCGPPRPVGATDYIVGQDRVEDIARDRQQGSKRGLISSVQTVRCTLLPTCFSCPKVFFRYSPRCAHHLKTVLLTGASLRRSTAVQTYSSA